MKNRFVEYFSSISPLTVEEAEGIAQSMQTRSFQKGDFLVREGQIASKTYFVLEGCIREYILLEGEEKTTNFFTEDQWAISLNGLSPGKPSTHYWVCAEDTTVVAGDEQQAQALFERFPQFQTISRTIMESALAEQKEALSSYYTDSPEKRYQKLVQSRPSLIQRIPQYQIASYIGVKPESLSRIRKRMASSPKKD
ncbi:Crp/Fnr family transcriptional regulator [Jiulongibacter sediminis]|jgi:CRP-like cAMP-binding protein|uniref:Crp/Fnr family transcriptional regulator n=1 Tax=Jiulongibacter sediminis TaxID=1605367 RepID=UPI0026ED48FA|nr:Crp/Fnr family transcriptional regulator [Jiulongibacter sediminis]